MSFGALGLLVATAPTEFATQMIGWRMVFLAFAAITVVVGLFWHGLYVAKGTPKQIIAELNSALRAAVKDPKRFELLTPDRSFSDVAIATATEQIVTGLGFERSGQAKTRRPSGRLPAD